MESNVFKVRESLKSIIRISSLLTVLFVSVACERQAVVKLPTIAKGYDFDWIQLDAKDMSTFNFCFPKIFIGRLNFLQKVYPDGKYQIDYHSPDSNDRGTLQPICTDKNANFVSKVCLISDNGGNPHNICISR